jgi:uncharacterized protein
MRIAVISDTHDHSRWLPLEALAKADEIWHLGDVCESTGLDALRALGVPLRNVRGNCDEEYSWPPTCTFSLMGLRIHLVHIPPEYPPLGIDLLLHGHTHRPRDEMVGRTRFLNPGSAGLANKGAPLSMGWLELSEGRKVDWTIQLLAAV